MVTWICLVMYLVLLHQTCHGWGSALVIALMLVCYNSSISTGVKLETTDVKSAMSVVMHQRHKTLMCSVSNERSSPNSAISLRGLWHPRRRRWQKRRLKVHWSSFKHHRYCSAVFNLSNVVNFAWFDVCGLYLTSEKKSFCFDHVLYKTLN